MLPTKFYKCTPTATTYALHANFTDVHEKVIFLVEADCALLSCFACDMQMLCANQARNQGVRGVRPFREPHFQKYEPPPPQTFQLHIWHRIPIMPISGVVPPIQHTEPTSWVLWNCNHSRKVRVYTVLSFSVIQIVSLKTKNEHYIRFSFFYLL